ncbi:hypothetical protein CAPTEDRAFT_223261 [Capitella teleta]|uniref:RNA polymerase II subunit B1 CTD phosphatase RPAP2 homolog n=1 Tax=Capitella teleta TaxID=283909 RepID=R7UVH9_CAPTE|nr:hypothetical protein CAPTEDRAFT_223261 [Capitella teleta]|eukprot:ELU07401.1 hypothetical protein CAPTEDRAFT_223261 [Capitella teleta]
MAGASKVKASTKKSTKKTEEKEHPNEEAEQRRKDELREKIKRRVAKEEKAFRTVERLIEEGIEAHDLIEAAAFINPTHYADVVEERSISFLCGYPLCDNRISNVPKQKYHISTKTNTVFDITDRKKFCSNHCFKASRVFSDQLSTSPVWLGEEEGMTMEITLYEMPNNSTSANVPLVGEEVFVSAAKELKKELENIEASANVRGEAAAAHVKEAMKQKEHSDLKKHVKSEDALTQKLEMRIHERKKSLQEAPTAEVLAHGRETTQQSSQTCKRQVSAVSQVTDLTSVRDMIRREEGEEAEKDDGKRRIGEAAAVVTELSSAEESPSVGFGEQKSSPIREAVKSVGEQLRGVKRVKEVLKEEINSLQRDNIVNVTEQFEERVKQRNLSLAQPPTPEVLQQGVETTLQARNVGASKGDSLGEMNEVIARTEARLEEHRRVIADYSFEVDEFGKTHTQETNVSKAKKVNLLRDLMKLKSAGETGKAADKDGDKIQESVPAGGCEEHQPLRKLSGVETSPDEHVKPKKKLNVEDVMENVRRLTAHRPDVATSEEKTFVKKKEQKKQKLAAIEVLQRSLCEWKTADTAKWLRRKNVSTTTGEFEEKYQKLCHRVDREELEVKDEEVEIGSDLMPQNSMPEFEKLKQDSSDFQLQVKEFYAPGMSVKEKKSAEEKQIILPCVDSLSQNAVRRKMVLNKLGKTMSELLLPLRMNAADVLSDVRQIVHTFNLSNTNISWHPAEWTLIAFVLLKIIALRNSELEKGFDGPYATHYFKAMTLSSGLMQSDIVSIVNFIKN